MQEMAEIYCAFLQLRAFGILRFLTESADLNLALSYK